MALSMKEQLVKNSKKTYAGTNERTFLTIHQTGNTTRGANAQAHANLQSKGNVRNASWQWQVDDKEAIKSFPHTTRCWHAGDGRGPGNLSSIAIEICVNEDGDYSKAIENAIELAAHIMREEGIDIKNVVTHGRWSRKNCPAQLLSGHDGITWDEFITRLRAVIEGHVPTPAPDPNPDTNGDLDVAKMPLLNLTNADKKVVTGPGVKQWQALLLANGYGPHGLVDRTGRPDGFAGAATKAYTGAFQRATNSGNARGADYWVGEKSWSRALGL